MSLESIVKKGVSAIKKAGTAARKHSKKLLASLVLSSALLLPTNAVATQTAYTPAETRPAIEQTIERRVEQEGGYEIITQGAGLYTNQMLHGFEKDVCGIDRFTTCESEFWQGLTSFYENDYVTVPTDSIHNGTVIDHLKPGQKPLELSVDDGLESLIRFKERADGEPIRGNDGRPVLDENCLISSLQRFAEAHEGFGYNITAYLNFTDGETLGGDHMREKLRYLAFDPSITLGYHTVNHESMKWKSAEWVRNDINAWFSTFERISGLKAREWVRTAAWPFGDWPRKPDAMQVIQEVFTSAYDAYGGMAATANHPRYSRFRVKRMEFHPVPAYGQPNTVAWAMSFSNQYVATQTIDTADASLQITASTASRRQERELPTEENASPAPDKDSPGHEERTTHSARQQPLIPSPVFPFEPTVYTSLAMTLLASTIGIYMHFTKPETSRTTGMPTPPIEAQPSIDTPTIPEPVRSLPAQLETEIAEGYLNQDLETVLDRIGTEDHIVVTPRAAKRIARNTLAPLTESVEATLDDTSIDDLAMRAVRVYNCHKERRVTDRYRAVQETLGLENRGQVIGLLQAHVASTYVEGRAPPELLSCHDHRAIIDKERYDKEIAELYVNEKTKTTADLARAFSRKRGMRMSRSTFERRAKSYINRTYKPAAAVRSRSGARKVASETYQAAH